MTLRIKLSTYGATTGPLYSIGPNLQSKGKADNRSKRWSPINNQLYCIRCFINKINNIRNKISIKRSEYCNASVGTKLKPKQSFQVGKFRLTHLKCIHYPLFTTIHWSWATYNFERIIITFYKTNGWSGTDISGFAFCISLGSTSSLQPQTAPVYVINKKKKSWANNSVYHSVTNILIYLNYHLVPKFWSTEDVKTFYLGHPPHPRLSSDGGERHIWCSLRCRFDICQMKTFLYSSQQ